MQIIIEAWACSVYMYLIVFVHIYSYILMYVYIYLLIWQSLRHLLSHIKQIKMYKFASMSNCFFGYYDLRKTLVR